MQTQNKRLVLQTVLITLVILLGWILGFWLDSYNYMDLWFYSVIAMFIFAPLSYLYYSRLKNSGNKNLKTLNIVFKITAWLGIIIFGYYLIIEIFDIFYMSFPEFPEITILETIWINIKLYFYPEYWFDLEYGLWWDIEQLSLLSPYFIIVALLYWSVRINKKLGIKTEE